jgi:xanthine/CO dehydrogenase XdhC/CoxF family maturation factor
LKHWQELGQILDRVLRLARARESCALATVTHIRGSAYRRPGARLLIEPDGSGLGGVSGGCLEEDVREVGLQVLRNGASRLLHYETGGDDTKVWGLGLGCDGEVDILVQPVPPEAALGVWAQVRERLEGDAPFAIASPLEEGAPGTVLVIGESGRLAGRLDDADAEEAALAAAEPALRGRRALAQRVAPRRVFVESLVPPPRLLVCGAGDDARPLVAAAAAVGFRVVVADHRAAYATRDRFPQAQQVLLLRAGDETSEVPADARTYAVVMTHSLKRDTEWVKRLAAADVAYLGVLGPRARTERMVAELPGGRRERIFGPVGLDLGADGPEQVALSILAEVMAVASGREPRHLRERAVALHA